MSVGVVYLPIIAMSIVNYSVFCQFNKRVVLPWRIASVDPPSLSFFHFYDSIVKSQREQLCSSHPSETFIGKGKNDLFPVDQELVIIDVVPVFGPYIKFVTGKVQVILKHVYRCGQYLICIII